MSRVQSLVHQHFYGLIGWLAGIAALILVAWVGWVSLAIADHGSQIAVGDSHHAEVLRRLDSCEAKLDRLLDR